MTIRCPSCGETLPDEARFCWACGERLAPEPRSPEERRLVSVLFCDLAGFTERSDRADPEDVRRVLVPFHAAVRREVERFGGHLDKFIGDGALAVFGAPVAHEDDPLRAVEAGLAILREVDDLAHAYPEASLRARAGVSTGVAIVQLGAGPQVGEAIAGDVVNTASRLQTVADPGSLLTDASTFPLIVDRVEATPLGAVVVKGKREPLAVFRVEAVHPAASAPVSTGDEPAFAGREDDVAWLRAAWDRVAASGRPHAVAVLGEPGLGKSRLIAEVAAASGGRWLWSRCPPYGEDVTFAAVAQLVRAALGIAPDAPRSSVLAGSDVLASSLGSDPEEVAWLVRHLRPLLGVGDDLPPPGPDESVAAWARVFAGLAGEEPLALVVDDAHWAELPLADLLARMPHLVAGAPILIVVAGRTETIDRCRLEGLDVRRLGPLPAVQIAQVLGSIAPAQVAAIDEEQLASVIDAAGGNPLYAVEFGRLLAEGQEVAAGIPNTVTGLIAARLDALPPEERTTLQDAAVVGRRFWVSALPAARDEAAAASLPPILGSLRQRGLIRDDGDGREGDVLTFAQTLVREVAYERLTRAQRLRRHRDVAGWLADHRDEVMGSLDAEAHHRHIALQLARAVGDAQEPELAEEARASFLAAGAKALQVDLSRATELLREALELTPPDDPARPELIVELTSAGRRAGTVTPSRAVEAYTEAFELARRLGDRQVAAEAMTRAAMDLAFDGNTERSGTILDEALRLLEDLPPTVTTARAYLVRAEDLDFAGRYDEVDPWLDRAEAILGKLPGSGLVPPRPRDEDLDERTVEHTNILLHLRGDVRCVRGDIDGGLGNIRRTIELARAVGSARSELTALSYLSEWVGLSEGPAATLPLQERALQLSQNRGFTRAAWWTRAERLWAVADLEDWVQVERETAHILEAGTVATGGPTRSAALWLRVRALLVMGRPEEAARLTDEAVESARRVEQIQLLAPALVAAALVCLTQDEVDAALAHVRELIAATEEEGDLHRMLVAPDLVRICLRAGDPDLAAEAVAGLTSRVPRAGACLATARAEIVEATGTTAEALAAWRQALAAWEPMGATIERRLAREAVERLSPHGAEVAP